MKKISTVFAFIFLLIQLCSCSYISYSMMGEDGRRNELRTVSAKLVKAVAWAEFVEVAKYTNNTIRDKAVRQLTDQYRGVKIKDVKETNLDFDDEVNTAYQVLEVEGFSSPSYVVKSEFVQFKWSFSSSTEGWKISEVTFSSNSSFQH